MCLSLCAVPDYLLCLAGYDLVTKFLESKDRENVKREGLVYVSVSRFSQLDSQREWGWATF